MSLIRGQEITLNGIRYTQIEPLGSGAVADAYAANLDGRRVVIKLLSERWPVGGEETLQCQREGEVLRVLNREEDADYADATNPLARARRAAETAAGRNIVALLDEGLDDDGRPFVIQELAPGKVEVRPVARIDDELRVLKIMGRVAQAMTLAHKCNFALRDFEPRTKMDRIRVREDGEGRVQEVRLIDWNITGGPELFAQDLFYFGGQLHYLLLGRHLDLESDGRPPYTLGLGMAAWNNITEGSRSILMRLLNREPSRRYQTAAELATDLAWMERTVELGLFATTADRLRDRAFEARGQDRYDRLLAVADLALRRLSPGDPTRQTFETLRGQARDELDKDLWQPLAMARVSLLAKQYSQAVANFDREIDRLDRRTEPARLARYLRLQAQVGQALRTQGVADPSQAREWAVLNQGVQLLVQRGWAAADREFGRAAEMRPALKALRPFSSLQGIASAGQLLENASTLQEQAQSRDEDVARDDWLAVETERIGRLTEAQGLLENADKAAPEEPFLADALESCKRELAVRQGPLPLLRSAEEALQQRRYRDAEAALRKVLAAAPGQPRASHLLPKAERHARAEEQIREAVSAQDAGDYADALAGFEAADRLIPGNPAVAEGRRTATAGLELLKTAEARIEQALQPLQAGQTEATGSLRQATALIQTARSSLGAVAGWQGQLIDRLLAQAGLLAVGPVTGAHRLVFSQEATAHLRNAEDQIAFYADRQVQETLTRIAASWNDLRFEEALDLVRQIAGLAGADLQPQLDDWAKRLQNCSAAGEALAQKTASLRQRWSGAGATDIDTALTSVRRLLDEHVIDRPDMPDLARSSARGLSAATLSFIGVKFVEPDQTFQMPLLDSRAEPLLGPPRALIEDLCKTHLAAQATATSAASQFQATVNILQNLKRFFGGLNDEQAVLLQAAQSAQRVADQAAEVLRQRRAEARGHLSAAEGLIRQEFFDTARRELREASDNPAARDDSEESQRIRSEVQRLWCKLVEADLALNHLKAARTDLMEGGVGEMTPSLRDRIVEGWRRLVRAQREPAEALRYIQEAAEEVAWCGQPEALNGDRDLLQDTALPIGAQAAARADWLAPAAQGGDAIRTINKALALLDDRLKDLLASERTWPALAAWAGARRDEMKAALQMLLADWDGSAEKALTEKRYADVLNLAEQGRQLVANTGWTDLLEALDRTAGVVRDAALAAIESDLAAAGQSWDTFKFADARTAVTRARSRAGEVPGLLTEALRDRLTPWEARLEGCIRAEEALRKALAAQTTPADTVTCEGVLRAFGPALALAAAADLPTPACEAARELNKAVAALIEQPDQPPVLPSLGNGTWPALRDAYTRIHRVVLDDLFRRLQPARDKGQHEIMIGLLNALGKLQDHLTPEQAIWLQSAEQALGVAKAAAARRAEAKANLEEAKAALERQDYESVRDRLAAALTKLPLSDDSDEAAHLRNQDADTWQQLVQYQIEPEAALKYASAGSVALGALSLGQALDRDLIPLKLAGEVRGQVEQFLPLAIGEQTTSVARPKIAELDRLLDAMQGTQPWERLAAWTRRRQVVVMERIAAWLDYLLNRAEEAKTTDYAAALAAVNEGLTIAPQSRWRQPLTDTQGKLLPIVGQLERLGAIQGEVMPLQEAREAFSRLRTELESGAGGLDSATVASTIRDIPSSRDAYVSRRLAHLDCVRAALDVSKSGSGPGQIITQVLDQLFKTSLPVAEAVTADWEWLGMRVPELRSKIVTRARDMVGKLASDLTSSTEALVTDPNSSLGLLGEQYWQARWGWAALGDPLYRGAEMLLTQMPPDTVNEWGAALQTALNNAVVRTTHALAVSVGVQLGVVVTQADRSNESDKIKTAKATTERLMNWRQLCQEQPQHGVILPPTSRLGQYRVPLPPQDWLGEAIEALKDLESAPRVGVVRTKAAARLRAAQQQAPRGAIGPR